MIGSIGFRGHDAMLRTLPPISMPSLEDRAPSPLPPIGHDISRPSSTSTQSSNALRHQHQHQQHQQQQHPPPPYGQQHPYQQQSTNNNHNINNHNNGAQGGQGGGGGVSLPGMSALASVASAQSPQLRSFSSVNQGLNNQYSAASPTPTSVGGQGNNPPICQNCQTSTTPLWRRDEIGSVLCNACGLFLKLHGRPRPISLKTDVIKSRNRVKSSGQALKKAAKALLNGQSSARSEAGTPPPGPLGQPRRVSQKSAGDSDRSNSPVSRTQTPTVLAPPPHHAFDHNNNNAPHHHHPVPMHPLSHSPSLPALHHFRQPSPGGSATGGERHLELPQTYEGLQHANNEMRTRINELELINGLFKGRVIELERTDGEQRAALQRSQEREADLQRRLERLERDFAEIRSSSTRRDYSPPTSAGSKRRLDIDADLSNPQDSPPFAKRSRLSDIADMPPSRYSEPPPSSTTAAPSSTSTTVTPTTQQHMIGPTAVTTV